MVCSSEKLFITELKKVSNYATPRKEAARGLLNLVQGGRRVANCSIEFQTVAADSKWNSRSLYDAFYNGLSVVIKDELVAPDPPLDVLIALVIGIYC